MATQTIDVSARINDTRVYGTLEWREASCEACAGVTPRYRGDTEQCGDCGRDEFDVVRDTSSVLATASGWALRCRRCGAPYPLRSEE